MKAEKILEKLTELIDSGKTVYISTAYKSTKIDKRAVNRFANIGRPLLKTDGKSLYLSVGNRYDCIDYCRFTYTD